MTVERFREVISAKPFRPFTIHLADGQAIPVASKEFVAPSPSGRTIVVFQPDDRMNILDLLLVTNLEVEPATATTRKRK
jgi:hypothetical protein